MNNPTVNFEIGELFRTNFSLFDSYPEDVKTAQIKKVCYIADIADQLGKNIYGVNLFELFNNNNNILMTENNVINRTLATFNRDEFIKKQEVELLSDENIENIGITYKERFKSDERGIQDNIDAYIREAQNRLRQHKECLRMASDFRRQKAELKQSSPKKVIDSINKLLETGKYKIDAINSESIYLLINDDVIMTYKKPSVNIDLRVNLGKFKLRISFNDGLKIDVLPVKNTILVRDIFHPHIGSSGDVCLGNMRGIHDEAILDDDIFTAVDAIHKVLYTYYDGDPYQPIDEFVINSKQIQPNGKILERVVRLQTHQCHECDSDIVIEFSSASEYREVECDECEYVREYEFDHDQGED